jgi:MATE family multidrug resistance protein
MSAHQGSSLPVNRPVAPSDVLGLAWPIMISMLSRTAMTTADSLFVGQLGTAPMAAVGLAGVLCWMGLSTGMGLLSSVQVTSAQRTGSGRHEVVRRLLWQGVWLALALGVLSALTAPLGALVFPLMGASEEAAPMASSYFALRMLGAPLTFVNVALMGWFQGRGDTRTPMVATVAANILNIAIDPLFIFGWGPVPAMGMPGAAIATVLSVGASMLFLIWRARPLAGPMVKPNAPLLRELWRIGLPVGVQWTLDVASFVAFVTLLARVGEAHLAAHVIAIRIVSISFLPGHAVGEASGVFVGQAIGARQPEQARHAWRAGTRVATVVMVAASAVFVFFPIPLISVFGADEQVLHIGTSLLMVAAGFQVFDAIAMVALGSLRGAGDTRWPMVVCVATAWLIKLPIGVLLAIPMDFGAAGAWMGLTVEIIVLAGLAVWRVRGSKWLTVAATQKAKQKARAKAA